MYFGHRHRYHSPGTSNHVSPSRSNPIGCECGGTYRKRVLDSSNRRVCQLWSIPGRKRTKSGRNNRLRRYPDTNTRHSDSPRSKRSDRLPNDRLQNNFICTSNRTGSIIWLFGSMTHRSNPAKDNQLEEIIRQNDWQDTFVPCHRL